MKKLINGLMVAGPMLLLTACGATETAVVQTAANTPTAIKAATVTLAPTDTPTREKMADPTATKIATQKPTASPTAVMEMATEEAMPEQNTMPHPTEAQQQLLDSLPIIGSPAELNNEVWLNSDPLKLTQLQGQVVIVEFWTYG